MVSARVFVVTGKNLGPAGVCVLIARKDLIERGASKHCPSVLDWKQMASSKPIASIYNTPPTFLVYMVGERMAGEVRAVQKR